MTGILILGGGGMVGRKLAHSLTRAPLFPDQAITLVDHAFADNTPAGVHLVEGNLTDPALQERLLETTPAIIVHLAAIVSGEAERDFALGWTVNMQAYWSLLQTVRAQRGKTPNWTPRFVFASSIAVFGPPYPDKIPDDFPTAPQTSYGAQKAICELMLSDVSRRGLVDGIALRLPTICVRPGKPNKAASSFFSNIIREPLRGTPATLPVTPDVRHWHASPRSAVGFLRHAAMLDLTRLEGRIALNMPGVSCTVEDQLDALEQVAGKKTRNLVVNDPDPTIARIVGSWPRDFAPERALSLGFRAETSFTEIIDVHIADEMPQS